VRKKGTTDKYYFFTNINFSLPFKGAYRLFNILLLVSEEMMANGHIQNLARQQG